MTTSFYFFLIGQNKRALGKRGVRAWVHSFAARKLPKRRWRCLGCTKNGLSLIELMVSIGIFMLLNGAVVALMGYNQRASEKVDANVDASTRVLILYEKLRMEMRYARVIDCVDDTLSYWIYQRAAGELVIGQRGHLLAFLPGGSSPPDLATISVVGTRKEVVRRFQGEDQGLAQLDRDGEFHLSWNKGAHLLRVWGKAGSEKRTKASLEAMKPFSFTLLLSNVE